MFGGLPEHEKEAFFGLLDGYFASRPHLLSGAATSGAASSSAVQSGAEGGINVSREDMQRAGKFTATPVGQKVTGMAMGRMVGNKTLGNAAAGLWAGHHKSQQQSGASVSGAAGNSASSSPGGADVLPAERRGPPPAAPSSATKPSSIGNLISGKSIGSLNLGPKTTTTTPPRKLSSPRVPTEAIAPSDGALPPPARLGPGVVPAPGPSAAAATVLYTQPPAAANEGLGYAEVLYDYGDPKDADDLVVVEGEQIVLLEEISDDWWRGRKVSGAQESGIVPTTYVRQL